MRKALFAAACVAALGLGTSALAQEAGNILNGAAASITGFNDTDDSTNVDFTSDGSFNDSSDNSQNTTVDINDVLNDNSDNSTNTTTEINDSLNDNSDTRASANVTQLVGTVAGVTIAFAAGAGAGAVPGGDNGGDWVSGNSRVDTSGSFAGVQNAGSNTGMAANALIANGISANADISFGD